MKLEYSNSILEIFDEASVHKSCGAVVVKGNCIPNRVRFTVLPLMVIVFPAFEYEFTVLRVPKIPMTSPAKTGIFTGIDPAVGLFWVKNSTVNAFVVAENNGGGTLFVNFTTAIFWSPEDAVVGTNKEVITKSFGAVKKYPLTLPVKVPVCAGIVTAKGPTIV